MTIFMALLGVVAAEFYETNNTISNAGNLTTYYNSINVTEFKQCLNANISEELLFITVSGNQKVLAFNGSDVFDENDMLDCLEQLGIEHGTWTTTNIEDFESMDSVVNVDEEMLEWFTETWYPVTRSSGQIGIQDGNSTNNSLVKRYNPQGVDVDAYSNNKCACCSYGNSASFTYWPSGCRVISSNSYKSASAFNYVSYKIKFGIYPHHSCNSGGLIKTVNAGGGTGCMARNFFSVKGWGA